MFLFQRMVHNWSKTQTEFLLQQIFCEGVRRLNDLDGDGDGCAQKKALNSILKEKEEMWNDPSNSKHMQLDFLP